jgi:hypothetical protein
MVTVGVGDGHHRDHHKWKSANSSPFYVMITIGVIITLLTSIPSLAAMAAPLGVCELNGLLPYPSHYTLPSIPSDMSVSSSATSKSANSCSMFIALPRLFVCL